ncbi:magnesium transporter CorA family protein [Marinilactibacillus sp. XAAS-LB27]|uniref:magnesium transporter CorA family protein n=1 Tax=Marinilactibacillus sp. XAAS-LB27 TaxID=3114538 RepID=UPI002E18BF1C|nr:magnesium transporter CorA family protein [Marinilactibacillus sp. XAAS-LB27]
MISYYNFGEEVNKSSKSAAEWVSVTNPTSEDIEYLSNTFDLPRDLFVSEYFPENITEIEQVFSNVLGECLYVVLINYNEVEPHSVENGLYPVTFIFNEDMLITIANEKDQSILPSIQNEVDAEVNSGELITSFILNMYQLYIAELIDLKVRIDDIDQRARNTTQRETLLDLTDAERDMVFLEQTLDDQKQTILNLLERDLFKKMEVEERTIKEIHKKIRKSDRLVEIYRDLIDTTGGLISDMIDSRLNRIMEFLDSAQLVIAVPTLIFSLWGINTGGLFGTDTPFGSLIVVILAAVLGLGTYLYLKKKEY